MQQIVPTNPEGVCFWTRWTSSIIGAPAGLHRGVHRGAHRGAHWGAHRGGSEGTDGASLWKLLLFGLISEPLWRARRPRGLRTKVGACSNKSNFVPNEEVRIGPFRFSSLKGPFKCILVCVIWSGESRTLGVGGHDDLASFSCSSQSWCHVSVQPSTSEGSSLAS